MLRLGSSVRSLATVRAQSTLAATSDDRHAEWEKAKPYHAIPGPKPLPLIGNTWRFIPGIGTFAGKDILKVIHNLHQEYGKIARFGHILGRKDLIVLFDPDDVETVYRNDGVSPIRQAVPSLTYYRNVTRRDFFKDAKGLGSTQGEDWRQFRSKVNHTLMQPKVTKNYITPIDQVALDFVKRIPMLRDSNGETPKDFINELYKWALESIAMIALDARLGCLEANLTADSEPQQMVNSAVTFFECMYELDMKIPAWRLMSTPTWRAFVKSMECIEEIGMKYVNLALERLKKTPPVQDLEMSVLQRILVKNSDPKIACVMALDMMMAGVDTTSHSVGFLLYHLAVNPDKQKILHEEIDRVLSKSQITTENLNDMKYLKACIKESMRLNPVAPGNQRTSNKDLVLQGYQIPKGTDLFLDHEAMSNMEIHYPQPEKFLPERWMKGEIENNAHPFASKPFGFGARTCIGRRFAELEVEVLVSRILQQYRLEWHHGPMVTESKLLNNCKSPLKLKIIDRTTTS